MIIDTAYNVIELGASVIDISNLMTDWKTLEDCYRHIDQEDYPQILQIIGKFISKTTTMLLEAAEAKNTYTE